MIVVSGRIEIAPGGVEQARAAMADMMRDTRKEAGCIVYEFSQLVESATSFRVYEEWESLDALNAHGKAAHMATFRAALGAAGVVSRDIFRMDGSEKTAL